MASNSIPNPLPADGPQRNPEDPFPDPAPGAAAGMGEDKGTRTLRDDIENIVQARHAWPHRVLGPHASGDGLSLVVRAFHPHADRVELRVYGPRPGAREMRRIHPAGVFETRLPTADAGFGYEFAMVASDGSTLRWRDPYGFVRPWFTHEDERLFVAGRHARLFEKLGARPFSQGGCEGVGFAVWAPEARRVSVVGTFNHWDGRRHPMRRLTASGVWDLFIPGIGAAELYKFEILPPEGPAFLKADPFASRTEGPPKTASVVPESRRQWACRDTEWVESGRTRSTETNGPAIYRLDLDAAPAGESEDGHEIPPLRRAARGFLAGIKAQGYSHIELRSSLPGHGGSAGPFAPGETYGTPDEFRAFIAACHRGGLGVIVPALESRLWEDYPELGWFDGTAVYETAEAGAARPFALAKGEVQSFLLSNAVFWLDRYCVDGLLTDRRAARLYRRLRDLEPRAYAGVRLVVRERPDGSRLSEVDVDRLVRGRHDDPHGILGPHPCPDRDELRLRAMLPGAEQVWASFPDEPELAYQLRRIHPDGLFETVLPEAGPGRPYRLGSHEPGRAVAEVPDPYAFAAAGFSESDEALFGQGSHYRIYEKLGAHPCTEAGALGVRFAVWAPHAEGVGVVGPFNRWDGRRHAMRRHGLSGVWEIFVPGLAEGAVYKYEIRGHDSQIHLKCDPYAFYAEVSPSTASIVHDLDGTYAWRDGDWMARRRTRRMWEEPLAIYEVHLGSWMRGPGNEPPSYLALADRLIPYVQALGFTHIELLPISEHPYEPSWGYQVTGYYAPTSRFGRPEDLMAFIDRCHQAGIGVILDWVPGHFPKDAHGLARFDGTCLYEHADPRQGEHRDWGTLVFNYGRPEVENFLIANARFWLAHYHFDGLRVDAVASMLYLDYSRPNPGDWIPNRYGGRENLEAIEFLKHANVAVYRDFPGALMIAEESTAWPGVSGPVDQGGLGFGYKWNMGWMHDVLAYMSTPPAERRHHHGKLSFGLVYAWTENYVLSLSHDEVVHLKGSLLAKMPGGEWEKFANLRLLYAFMYGHPGKKLLFMGAEFGQPGEWNHAAGLPWDLLARPPHQALETYLRDLNRLYRSDPAFFEVDFKAVGFEWIDSDNAEESIVAFLRKARDPRDTLLFVMNFSGVSRPRQRIGVPYPVSYREILNTNAAAYGGCAGIAGKKCHEAEEVPWNGREFSIIVPLPALTALVLKPAPPHRQPADQGSDLRPPFRLEQGIREFISRIPLMGRMESAPKRYGD